MKALLVLCLLPFSLMAGDICINCPTCQESIVIKSELQIDSVQAGIFGDTWICPNQRCGYENYTAIRYCALCGTEQPKRR